MRRVLRASTIPSAARPDEALVEQHDVGLVARRSVPPPIATETGLGEYGASFTPSPIIATTALSSRCMSTSRLLLALRIQATARVVDSQPGGDR